MKKLLLMATLSLVSNLSFAAQVLGTHATTVTTLHNLYISRVAAKSDMTVQVSMIGECGGGTTGGAVHCNSKFSIALDLGCETDRLFYQQLSSAEGGFSMVSITMDASGTLSQIDVAAGGCYVVWSSVTDGSTKEAGLQCSGPGIKVN